GDLEIRFIELENVAPGLVRANIQSAEGAAYDESLIDSDIRSLYRTGLFEYIEVKRDFQSDGTVDLIFELRPKYRVAGVYFKGEKEVTRRRLNREVTIRKNDALDERNVRLDAEKLHEFYQNRGFSEAVVTYNIERDRSSGTGIVTFIIDEGRRVKIKRVEFTGNDSISDRRLRKA